MLALCMCVRALANYDLLLTEHGPNRERGRESERRSLNCNNDRHAYRQTDTAADDVSLSVASSAPTILLKQSDT